MKNIFLVISVLFLSTMSFGQALVEQGLATGGGSGITDEFILNGDGSVTHISNDSTIVTFTETEVNNALTSGDVGNAAGNFEIGFDPATGEIFYKNALGNWAALPSGSLTASLSDVYDANGDKLGFDLELNGTNYIFDSMQYCVTLTTYAELDAYEGAQKCVILNNSKYGGIWVDDATITPLAGEEGVERNGVGSRKWKRLWDGALQVNWWNPSTDGLSDATVEVQAALDYATLNDTKVIEFGNGDSYLIDSILFNDNLPNTESRDFVLDGNKSTILSSDPNNAVFTIDGMVNGTVKDLNFTGSATGFNNGSNILLYVNENEFNRNIIIEKCFFENANSYAIKVDNVTGDIDFQGVIIKECIFKFATYDATSTEQYQIYLGDDAEYNRILDCTFYDVPSSIKCFDGANSLIQGNLIEVNNSNNNNYDKACIYIAPTASNDGKVRIQGNIINHNQGSQPAIYVEGNGTDVRPCFITDNQVLVHGPAGASIIEECIVGQNTTLFIVGNHLWNRDGSTPPIRLFSCTQSLIDDNFLQSINNLVAGIYIEDSQVQIGKNEFLNLIVDPEIVGTSFVRNVYETGTGQEKLFEYNLIGQDIASEFSYDNISSLQVPPDGVYFEDLSLALTAIEALQSSESAVLNVFGNYTLDPNNYTATQQTVNLPDSLTIKIHSNSRLEYPRAAFNQPSFYSDSKLTIIQDNPNDVGILLNGATGNQAHGLLFEGTELNLENVYIKSENRAFGTYNIRVNNTNAIVNMNNCKSEITANSATAEVVALNIDDSSILNADNCEFIVLESGGNESIRSIATIIDSGDVNFDNCRFEGFHAAAGGVVTTTIVRVNGGDVEFENCDIVSNGDIRNFIFNNGYTSIEIDNSNINRVDGGIAIQGASVVDICLNDTKIFGTTTGTLNFNCSSQTNMNEIGLRGWLELLKSYNTSGTGVNNSSIFIGTDGALYYKSFGGTVTQLAPN